MQAESGGKIEQVFVANGLLCWMYLIRQDLEEALQVMQTFRERCKKRSTEADCEHRYIFVPAASVSGRYSGDPGVA